MADLENWSGNEERSLYYCNLGLKYHPDSEEFMLKKARMLIFFEKFDDAFLLVNRILSKNPTDAAALKLAEILREASAGNSFGFTYDYDSFDKIFDAWHAGSVSYSNRTPIGSVIARVNAARRFNTTGYQFEADMYPRFADGLYSYLNFGYSDSPVFPRYRFGASVYVSLPYSFEIDGGIRYLKFSSSNTAIYTAALGKYYGNFWFSLRTFLTPSSSSSSVSFTLLSRYYFSGADEYINISAGSGISPDDRIINETKFLLSRKAGAEYQMKLQARVIWGINAQYSQEEISQNDYRTRISIGTSFKFIF